MPKRYLLDGPMGTEIDRRGGNTQLPLWSARSLMISPSMVKEIHIDYLKAGADIITTNTFRSKDYNLVHASEGRIGQKLTMLATDLAKSARDQENPSAKIAGSISPLEDCYSPNLVPDNSVLTEDHGSMAKWLAKGGIDLFLIETMNTMREIEIAVQECQRYDIPIWISVTLNDAGEILSGESLMELIDVYKSNVDAILVNCSSLQATNFAMENLRMTSNLVYGAYPNFGSVDDVVGWQASEVSSDFMTSVKNWIQEGATIIGTCCGATPKETEEIRNYLNSLKN